MTQAELGSAIGVAQQTVGAWESGRAMPSADKLTALADVLGVTADELLGRPVLTSGTAADDLDAIRRADPEQYEVLVAQLHLAAQRARRTLGK